MKKETYIKRLIYFLIAGFIFVLGYQWVASRWVREIKVQIIEKSLSSNILISQAARKMQDLPILIHSLEKVYQYDKNNTFSRQRLFEAYLHNGNISEAYSLSKSVLKTSEKDRYARLLGILFSFRQENFIDVMKHLSHMENTKFNHFLQGLVMMWANFGKGQNYEALEWASWLEKYPSFPFLTSYNIALLRSQVGDYVGAERAYRKAAKIKEQITEEFLTDYAQLLHVQGKTKIAFDLLQSYKSNMNPEIINKGVDALKTPAILVPITASQGLAFSLMGVSRQLSQNLNSKIPLLYLHFSSILIDSTPRLSFLLGEVYAKEHSISQAKQYFNKVPKSSCYYEVSQIGLSYLYSQENNFSRATQILESLPHKTYRGDIRLAQLYEHAGLLQKSKELFEHLIHEYEIKDQQDEEKWKLYFSYALVLEKLNNNTEKEEVLLKALSRFKDQAIILNYLGYSWVDKGVRLKEAMDMIQRAVVIEPRNVSFIDSLGWGYYKLGDYKHAVFFLERAIEMDPNNIEIINHLGDALWKIGRQVEARYQWKRALYQKIQSDLRHQIQYKIDYGLSLKNPRT